MVIAKAATSLDCAHRRRARRAHAVDVGGSESPDAAAARGG